MGRLRQGAGRPRDRTRLAALSATLGFLLPVQAFAIAQEPLASNALAELANLSIEELANIDVSSVSKTTQPLSDAPAAIYVITHDEVIRSGATNIPDILRLAPNLHVAQITASSHAISARGFNGSAADKLLVLIDGRSVYTPFSHGVFWNAQHVLPDDIERVEVISGPGATLWGANAVNGVINIVTRRSTETQGGVLEVGAGDLEQRASLRYGGPLGEALTYRVYADGVDFAHGETASGADARDGWRRRQAGFRLDWSGSDKLITLQGDAYRGTEQAASAHQEISGHNLIARWTHPTRGGGTLQAQAYYDHLERAVPGRFHNRLSTYDLDVQHSFSWGQAHQVVWGGGYRVTKDHFPITPTPPRTQFFAPVGRRHALTNLFVQDTVTLNPALKLTLGLKLEDDPYSGLEALPTARLSWKPTDTSLVWAAVSRAVRAPSRLDRDFVELTGLSSTSTVRLTGRDFQPETVIAYELGLRAQPSARSSVSVSTFYNVYDDLRSFELTGGRLPIVFANRMEGETYGVEVWGAYQVTDWWRLSGGANWLRKSLRYEPGASKIVGTQIAGNDPTYQASIRSMMDLGRGVSLDLDLRKIGALPNPASRSYAELGARIAWAVSRSLEISITGANLLNDHHPEFGASSANVQIGAVGVESGRSLFIDLRWGF
ncbi:TonB-dependent siderophore receptor [Phenylobacterium sp.]|uniref:TonB-dependent receptor plug domain-containing protein n=1 Tax=Phenylobacterium sp. TaxID=1871053 RepID=UPI002734C382|nr:TonB-dependent receptor [Phenylobacterium sp.]MDP3853062.1 TonB-dependent receptor [Phenylobacterium sp.]